MKHEFLKSTFDKVRSIARKKRFIESSRLLGQGMPDKSPDEQLRDAVANREEARVRELLGVTPIGERMPDGTIYAGVSPESGQHLFTMPADARYRLKWKPAMDYAACLDAHGHKDWRLPTTEELDVLYRNRDTGLLKGTFNKESYWSSNDDPDYPDAWMKWFGDGFTGMFLQKEDCSVRPVRSGPRP